MAIELVSVNKMVNAWAYSSKFTRLQMDTFHDDVEDSREKTLLKIALYATK